MIDMGTFKGGFGSKTNETCWWNGNGVGTG